MRSAEEVLVRELVGQMNDNICEDVLIVFGLHDVHQSEHILGYQETSAAIDTLLHIGVAIRENDRGRLYEKC